MKELNIRGIFGRAILHHFNTNKIVIMESISEKDVKAIDASVEHSKNIAYRLKNGKLLTQDDIILYGHIDLDNEKDRALLEKHENKIWDWTDWNHIAYSEVNYNTGIVKRNENKDGFLWYSMVDLVKWIRYNLLLINNRDSQNPKSWFLKSWKTLLHFY